MRLLRLRDNGYPIDMKKTIFFFALCAVSALSVAGPASPDARLPVPSVQTPAPLMKHLSRFIGQKVVDMGYFAQDVITALPKDASIISYRFIKPMDAVTMDYNVHRINIYLDYDSKVIGFRVG